MNTNPLLTPQATAQLLGVNVQTLHRWEREETLIPQRSEGGHRRYNPQQVRRMQCLKKMKAHQGPCTFFWDFDSTLYPHESLDEMLSMAIESENLNTKTIQEIKNIGHAGMNGKITITESVRQRLSLISPDVKYLEDWLKKAASHLPQDLMTLTANLAKTHTQYVITGGFRRMVQPLLHHYSIPQQHLYSNWFRTKNSSITGFIASSPLCQPGGKAHVVEDLQATGGVRGLRVAIGDGASDMRVRTAGKCDIFIGVGYFQKRPVVQASADFYFDTKAEFASFMQKHFLT